MADSWPYIKARDAISGKEGTLYATIEGEVVAVAECKTITAKIAKNKSEFKALGYRGTQHKATGWSGTGDLTLYFATSFWSKLMVDYVKTGRDQYFTLKVTNEDPTSKSGRQVITLYDVNLDEAEVAKLDTDAEFLEQSVSFTFSGIEMDEAYDNEEIPTTKVDI